MPYCYRIKCSLQRFISHFSDTVYISVQFSFNSAFWSHTSHQKNQHVHSFNLALLVPHGVIYSHALQFQYCWSLIHITDFTNRNHKLTLAACSVFPLTARWENEGKQMCVYKLYCPFVFHISNLSTLVLFSSRIACISITASATASISMEINESDNT